MKLWSSIMQRLEFWRVLISILHLNPIPLVSPESTWVPSWERRCYLMAFGSGARARPNTSKNWLIIARYIPRIITTVSTPYQSKPPTPLPIIMIPMWTYPSHLMQIWRPITNILLVLRNGWSNWDVLILHLKFLCCPLTMIILVREILRLYWILCLIWREGTTCAYL